MSCSFLGNHHAGEKGRCEPLGTVAGVGDRLDPRTVKTGKADDWDPWPVGHFHAQDQAQGLQEARGASLAVTATARRDAKQADSR